MSERHTFGPVQEYWLDAWQRWVLFLDVLRERGNGFYEHQSSTVPNVLNFEAELVSDGRNLPRPVNYLLARMRPPEGAKTDPAKRPFIVVDPRAGHGPGIGGMKQESEIGAALAAGHPCYFIGFLPEPVPGQTVEDVCLAEAAFIEQVAAMHPDAAGKPVIIANCQAGWQIMMTAAIRPELAGPIMLAGSPLSYWAGVRGKNPLRYLGGVMGGSWTTALAGDLGGGIFDGAHLVANFESMNPANTFWTKPYNVYSKVDTEAARFLDFETWWGSPVLLNAGEMQSIADNLFIGNKLAPGGLRTSDGVRVDLRNIRSPIIMFCSWGDDITPPQQALGWITDVYSDDREILANGQTLIYTLHQTIGHLGIFVSGRVASKEHREFVSCMDMIDMMPPGLYEAVITEVDGDTQNAELIDGKYLFRLEPRSLDDIRALGANSPEDDLRFATAARVSEVNVGLYRSLLGPTVRAMTSKPMADAIRAMHPNRLRFALFSDANPMMASIGTLAKEVRERRAPVSQDNPLLAAETVMSSWITMSLKAYGAARDAMTERLFLGAYGSPLLQAMVGLGRQEPSELARIERDLVREEDQARLGSELRTRFEVGRPVDAALRGLIYVSLPTGADERSFTALKALHEAQPAEGRRSLGELKSELKEQFLLVRLDEERAIEAIPKLLPKSAHQRQAFLAALHRVIDARGELAEEGRRRLDRVDALFSASDEGTEQAGPSHA
jgi:hypothetical protein